MNRTCFALLLILSLAVTGCTSSPAPRATGSDESKIKANLAKLDPADQKLAEEQKFCAVDNENRLGVMGAPFKVMVKDEPVFLCCDGCKKTALADPDKTLAKVKELRGQATGRE
jgi:hypothetical protein